MHKKYDKYLDNPDKKVESVKVALYLRLSRDDGDKSESNPITNQHKYLA